MNALDRGYADPRWGGYRQIQGAGGHVRKGEKGTPILYVDFNRRTTVRDDQGKPVLDDAGYPVVESVRRDRPLVKLHYVFNVEQTEGLNLRSLQTAAPAWEAHERAEALMRASGVRVAGRLHAHGAARAGACDRAPEPAEPADAGRPRRLRLGDLREGRAAGGDRRDDDGREARRRTRAAARDGVGSWVKALQNDPREIRAAAVDAQRISDWLMARERERTAEHEQPSPERANREGAMAPTPERVAMPVRVGNGGERAEQARGRAAAPPAGHRTQPRSMAEARSPRRPAGGKARAPSPAGEKSAWSDPAQCV